MKKTYIRKQIAEAETEFDRRPPTVFEFVNAVFNDEDYSQKLALQARVWIEVEAPHDKRRYDSGVYDMGIKSGQVVPEMFPVVDVKQRGRSKIALVCSRPSMHHEALTFMELKTKFLDAKAMKDDVVAVECYGRPVGDIVAVNVRTGRIPGEGRYYGGGQHVIVIKCAGSQEFVKIRDEGRLRAADIRESRKYTKKQIREAISYWKKQLAKGNYRKLNESASSVALTGEEQYLGPSMGTYRMTLKKNGRVQDTYEWECFLFNQANSDGCGEAIGRFAKNDPEFADLLDGYEDDIMDVGIVEDSWEDPDGVYELSISPSTVQCEDFPAGWHAPMTSVVLEPDQLELLGKDSSSAGNLNESNPYSPESIKAQGYCAFFYRGMDPVLAVDFSRTAADLPRGAYGAAIDLIDRGGVAGQATFFMKRADAIRTLRETYLDQQGGATAEYLYALVDEHAIPAALADELETANVGVAEAFVCGNDTVILGRDALEDACAEWRGAVVEEA